MWDVPLSHHTIHRGVSVIMSSHARAKNNLSLFPALFVPIDVGKEPTVTERERVCVLFPRKRKRKEKRK